MKMVYKKSAFTVLMVVGIVDSQMSDDVVVIADKKKKKRAPKLCCITQTDGVTVYEMTLRNEMENSVKH